MVHPLSLLSKPGHCILVEPALPTLNLKFSMVPFGNNQSTFAVPYPARPKFGSIFFCCDVGWWAPVLGRYEYVRVAIPQLRRCSVLCGRLRTYLQLPFGL